MVWHRLLPALGLIGLSACQNFNTSAGDEDLALASESQCGYQQNAYGARVSWKGVTPTIYLDTSLPTQFDQAIQQAADQWQQAAGKKLINIVRDPNITYKSAGDTKNFILYVADTWDPKSSLQQATTTIYWTNNAISKSTTRIDAVNFQFYTGEFSSNIYAVHMPSLMVHELGHALGLVHVTVTPTVMFPTLASDTENMIPSPADQGHITCEY